MREATTTGAALLQFAGADGGPFVHMDSGAVHRGRLYAADSTYNESPMENSVEVFDPRTMQHAGSHSFGIDRGSLTWIDRHEDSWWAAFANYDRVFDGKPYGETNNTQVVKSELRWIATVRLPGVEGQSIAWDLDSRRPTPWAIQRSTKQVLQFEVPYRDIAEPPAGDWQVNGPGHFES